MNPGPRRSIETLILNGCECEPYITCDDMLMRERAAEIIAGLEIVRHALQAEQCLIGIEENKPQAIQAMRRAAMNSEGVEVVPVPTLYPAGSEKQLVKVLTGKEVPSNGLAISIGVVGVNVGTMAAVYRAVRYGEPLISRIVTVTGGAVRAPGNLEILIGTPMEELITECAGDPAVIDELIMGGPMMGFALNRTDLPVIKTTNCVLAATTADLPPRAPVMPCIRCGACADACPVSLLPQQLYWFSKNKDLDKAQEFNLFDCIECGCCSYVCPSNIPLVQYYRYAKGDIWVREREKEKADIARRRHETRLQRLEREKAEREARRQRKKSEVVADAAAEAQDKKKAAIEAAMQRAEARRKSVMEQAQSRRPPQPGESGTSAAPRTSADETQSVKRNDEA
jgi:electron transport complex protein RnfC